MLILLNQEIVDVGDPVRTLTALGAPVGLPPTAAKLVQLGQDAAFAGNGLESAHAGIRRTLAALIALNGQANCALFLCPERARSARDVAVRLGLAPITTMAQLLSAQQAGVLTANLINQLVWRVAGGEAAA